MNLQYDRAKLIQICQNNNIKSLYVFGSYARSENTDKSDIDLLVNYDQPVSLLVHANIQNTLQDFFDKPVDLVIETNLKPSLKPYITSDLVRIYEKE